MGTAGVGSCEHRSDRKGITVETPETPAKSGTTLGKEVALNRDSFLTVWMIKPGSERIITVVHSSEKCSAFLLRFANNEVSAPQDFTSNYWLRFSAPHDMPALDKAPLTHSLTPHALQKMLM